MRHRLPSLSRYAGIYGALIRYSLIHEMQFKVNFLLWIVVEALWFGLQLAFMTVLYGHTDQICRSSSGRGPSISCSCSR
jgi:ABC-2 type transport system permease protein